MCTFLIPHKFFGFQIGLGAFNIKKPTERCNFIYDLYAYLTAF